MLYRESVTPANSHTSGKTGSVSGFRMVVGGDSTDATMRTDGLRECTAARGSAMAGAKSWTASIGS